MADGWQYVTLDNVNIDLPLSGRSFSNMKTSCFVGAGNEWSLTRLGDVFALIAKDLEGMVIEGGEVSDASECAIVVSIGGASVPRWEYSFGVRTVTDSMTGETVVTNALVSKVFFYGETESHLSLGHTSGGDIGTSYIYCTPVYGMIDGCPVFGIAFSTSPRFATLYDGIKWYPDTSDVAEIACARELPAAMTVTPMPEGLSEAQKMFFLGRAIYPCLAGTTEVT